MNDLGLQLAMAIT